MLHLLSVPTEAERVEDWRVEQIGSTFALPVTSPEQCANHSCLLIPFLPFFGVHFCYVTVYVSAMGT